MVLLHGRGHAAHHQQRLVFARLGDLHHLEAAGQGRVFLDVLLVLGPGGGGHGAQAAAGQGRLEQVGGITGTGRATGTDQGVGFIDEQNDRFRRGLNILDDLAQALFELALHACPGLQQADIQAAQFDVLERRRDIAGDDTQGKAFDHCGLAHTGFTGEDRVVLPATHEDIHQLADLFITADDRVELAAARLLGEVNGKALERFLFAQGAGGHGTAGFARHGAGIETVAGAQGVFRRITDILVKTFAEGFDLDLGKLRRQAEQGIAQARGLEDTEHQVAGAHLALAEHQAAIHPATLDGFFDVGRQIGDRGRAAGQAVQGIGQLTGQARGLKVELADDAVQVRVLQLQQLMKPVGQFHIRVAPQFAEHRGGLDGLVSDAVEFAEQRGAADFTHVPDSLWIAMRSPARRSTEPVSDPWHRVAGGPARYRNPGVDRC
ncbi:hypothetical protein D3C79_669640 [compost metagenome]